MSQGRVNGVLGVSRALGDFYLRPAVSSQAHVGRAASCEGNDRRRIIVGCDGLFDELSDSLVARLAMQGSLECAAERLVLAALALGSSDNVSVLLAGPRNTSEEKELFEDSQEDELDDDV